MFINYGEDITHRYKTRNNKAAVGFPLLRTERTRKSCFLLFIPIKFTINRLRLQDDATSSMEIHSNPATITFNIDIQSNIKLHTTTNLKQQKTNVRKNKLQEREGF